MTTFSYEYDPLGPKVEAVELPYGAFVLVPEKGYDLFVRHTSESYGNVRLTRLRNGRRTAVPRSCEVIPVDVKVEAKPR